MRGQFDRQRACSTMLSRTVFVSEISDVEIRYCVIVFSPPPFRRGNMSSENFGQLAGAVQDFRIKCTACKSRYSLLLRVRVDHELRERRDAAAQSVRAAS